MSSRCAASCLLLCPMVVASALAAPAAQYEIFDVQGAGMGSYQGTLPVALNEKAESTGYYIDSSGNFHGFVRASDGTITAFDVSGRLSQTEPTAINGKGDIAGVSLKPEQQVNEDGFLRRNNGTIERFSAGGANTAAGDLNDGDDIVGNFSSRNRHFTGYIRAASGGITDIRDPRSGSGLYKGTSPSVVNNAGVIAGSYLNKRKTGGFVRNPDGTFANFYIPGAGGSLGVYPDAINLKGVVAGEYTDSNYVFHGFVRYPSGAVTTFDVKGTGGTGSAQGTFVFAVADDDTVAGSYTDANGVSHGYMRLGDGTIRKFDAPGAGTGAGEGTFALSINKTHVIAGFETDNSGVDHGFLRTP